MKFRKITFIIIVLFLVSLTINGALSLINDNNVKYVKYDINNKKKVDLINEMYDLKSKINEFYIYNISNEGKNLSKIELKEQGGVCNHWANYWVEKAKELGFNAEVKKFFVKKEIIVEGMPSIDVFHEFALINNNDAWCIASNNWITCREFIGGNV